MYVQKADWLAANGVKFRHKYKHVCLPTRSTPTFGLKIECSIPILFGVQWTRSTRGTKGREPEKYTGRTYQMGWENKMKQKSYINGMGKTNDTEIIPGT